MISRIRGWLVAMRDGLDARLHDRRRARARARLGELAPSSVLVLCLGNVCRSPYAERVWRARSRGRTSVDSAGFIGPNRAPPDSALDVARARGIDHADHRSKTVTPALLAASEAIFVFDRLNVRRLRRSGAVPADRVFWLGDLDPLWAGKRAIVDPWGRDADEFDRTFERIERCVDAALHAIGDTTSE